jgi:signal peptidase complex subunit 1
MADQILDQIRDVFEGQIDFDGQRRSEVLATLLLAVTGVRPIHLPIDMA